MTLNLTLLTPNAIYQSADYRLSNPITRQALDLPSTKRVSLHYLDWSGFITYTGIGSVGTTPTTRTIETWLEGKPNLTFRNVCEVLRSRAGTWLRGIRSSERHTFIIAGFVDGRATAALVSNSQRWHGSLFPKVAVEFVTSEVISTGRPDLVITGVAEAVTKSQKRKLMRLAELHANDPARLRRDIEETSRLASKTHPNLISEDCIVYSIDRHGRSYEEAFGHSVTSSTSVMAGTTMEKMIAGFLSKQFPQGYSIRSAAGSHSISAKVAPVQCRPRTVPNDSGYHLELLALSEGRRATPRAINGHGVIVGEAAPKWGSAGYPCFWPTSNQLVFLPNDRSLGGAAFDLNDGGTLVGQIQLDNGSTRACTWSGSDFQIRIKDCEGLYNQALRISPSGHAVGYTNVHESVSGQLHHRPTSWPSNGATEVLHDLNGGWGEAIDINRHDQILLRVHARHVSAWLWYDNEITKIENPILTADFWPHRITDEGAVIGNIIEKAGARYAAMWRPGGQWVTLFQPKDTREFQAASEDMIGGMEEIERYLAPWVKREGGPITRLPKIDSHHHRITGISDTGRIIGSATSDNCSHPLLWTHG